jgi:hypothetical protein
MSAGSDHFDVGQAEFRGLVKQPINPALHGFNQNERDIRTRHSQNKAGQTSPTSNVADRAGREQRRHQDGVHNMAGPQPWKLERSDEAQFLSSVRKVGSEASSDINRVSE